MQANRNDYWIYILFSIFLFSGFIFYPIENEAEGKLIVNDEEIKFNYAYAFAQEGFFDKSQEDIVVIITDIPIPQEVIEDSFERKRMMSRDDLHCVEVVISHTLEPISVTILHNAFEAPPSGRGYEILKVNKLSQDIIEGEIHTSKPNEFFGTTYEYNAIFKANIFREIPPTDEEKKQAEESKHAAIYKLYEKCIINSDFDGLKNLVTPDVAAEMSREEADDMFEFMQFTMPTDMMFAFLQA